MSSLDLLAPALLERTLDKLGLRSRPEPTREGLAAVYDAWCRRVPSDNVLKLIHLRSDTSGPLPGHDAGDFFEAWLRHGTGSTCWGASGAMHTLLTSLGFRSQRVVATIVFGPDLPPNHGTTVVEIEDECLLVDTSLLHGNPLPLSKRRDTAIEHPAWGMPARFEDGHHWFTVRPLLTPSSLECRMDLIGASQAQVSERLEATREWGPFNYALAVRSNRGDSVIGTAWTKHVVIEPDGTRSEREFEDGERERWLVEEIGLSEEIVTRLPADLPTPPPPGSRTEATTIGSA